LAVSLAEMAFAGGLGATVNLAAVDATEELSDVVSLFSESNTRFLIEVAEKDVAQVQQLFVQGALQEPLRLGTVTSENRLTITGQQGRILIDESLADLKSAWQTPLSEF
jgi:phosphoribosylformylglycinamidine synthase